MDCLLHFLVFERGWSFALNSNIKQSQIFNQDMLFSYNATSLLQKACTFSLISIYLIPHTVHFHSVEDPRMIHLEQDSSFILHNNALSCISFFGLTSLFICCVLLLSLVVLVRINWPWRCTFNWKAGKNETHGIIVSPLFVRTTNKILL